MTDSTTKSAKELSGRFHEVIFEGTWVAGTNYKAQLEGLDWKLATTRIGTLNTIAALVSHVHYYIAGILEVLRGGALTIRDKYSFDFPPITGQSDWDRVLEKFFADSAEFAARTASLTDQQLNEAFADPKYGSYSRNLNAMIEHAYYHLGQISLIRKQIAGMNV